MKAVRYNSYGDSDVLVHEEVELPVAGAGQVVLRVAGTAFNMLDVAIRARILELPVRLPHIPNVDVAGVITEVGDGVTGWSVGDAVFVRSDAALLAELIARVDAGDLQIDVAERRPLADLAAVHDEAVAGRLAGKTVLIP